jgi:hypothetical protein
MSKSGNIHVMGRQKEKREPREPVQVPKNWMSVARKLAAEAKQPLVWYLLSVLAEKAEEAEIEHPQLPWEIEEE